MSIELPTSTVRLSEKELKEAKKTAKAAHENNLFNTVCVDVLLNMRFSKLYSPYAGINPFPNENNSTGSSGHASQVSSRTQRQLVDRNVESDYAGPQDNQPYLGSAV